MDIISEKKEWLQTKAILSFLCIVFLSLMTYLNHIQDYSFHLNIHFGFTFFKQG